MTICDAGIDWDSNKKEVIVDDKGEERQESDDDDLSLEKNDGEEASDNDDMAYDFTYPAQVSLFASLIVNYLNVLISFLVTKVTLKFSSTEEMDWKILSWGFGSRDEKDLSLIAP